MSRTMATTAMNGSVRYKGNSVECYSPSQMRDMYPDNDYRLIGETLWDNSKPVIFEMEASGHTFKVSNPGEHSKALYRKVGYLPADAPDSYVALLKNRFPLLALLFALLIALLLSMGFISCTANQGENAISIPEIDPNVHVLPSEGTQTSSEGGGGMVSMVYTLDATLDLATGQIAMDFENPSVSNHDVVLTLYIEDGTNDYEIAQSGRIASGYGLTTMAFNDSVQLSPGTYQGFYKVAYYDAGSGDRALVESDITDVVITVI